MAERKEAPLPFSTFRPPPVAGARDRGLHGYDGGDTGGGGQGGRGGPAHRRIHDNGSDLAFGGLAKFGVQNAKKIVFNDVNPTVGVNDVIRSDVEDVSRCRLKDVSRVVVDVDVNIHHGVDDLSPSGVSAVSEGLVRDVFPNGVSDVSKGGVNDVIQSGAGDVNTGLVRDVNPTGDSDVSKGFVSDVNPRGDNDVSKGFVSDVNPSGASDVSKGENGTYEEAGEGEDEGEEGEIEEGDAGEWCEDRESAGELLLLPDERDEDEAESEDDPIVCFGQGEDDSDEVSEDDADVGRSAAAAGGGVRVRGSGVTPVTTTSTTTTTTTCSGAGTVAVSAVVAGGDRREDAPYSQTGVTNTADNSLNEANDHSHDDDDDPLTPGSQDASALPALAQPSLSSGADNRAVFALMQELDHERSVVMKEIENEEQHRAWFYRQLEIITSKLETLPLTDTYNLQTDMARRQLEFEAQQVQGAMTDKLGSTEQSSHRQEARLRRIRLIETQMVQLQRRQLAQRASAVGRRDVGTSTTLTKAMFTAVPGQQAGGSVSDRVVAKTTDGRYVATLAVQTADVTLTKDEGQGGMGAGIPLNADVASAMYHGAWPIHKDVSVHSSGGSAGDLGSVMSFTSTNTHSSLTSQSSIPPSAPKQPPQQLGTKVEMVYSLLSMLGTHDKDDMSRTLLAMSSSQDSCIAMRQSGCLPLLIQLLHGSDKDSGLLGNTRGSAAARARASAALHNIVHSNPDDKRGRREARTLRLLEQIRAHCDQQRGETTEEEEEEGGNKSDIDHHPGPAIAALMKLSFDEDYRHAICTLGGLQAMAELLEVDHSLQGNTAENYSVTVRRYACMALTNLTFGDGKNKALLCSMRPAMQALVAQLRSPNEDLCQGAASVLRNLSWRADLASKKTLREVGAVTSLMESAMAVKKETTLKSILSALWNLSSHCSENKAEICAVKGALEFLVSLLTFKSAGKTHAIVENGGGILRNVSSQVAVREDYRCILRHKGCLQLLLSQLRSTSLTIVSNACGTLWNLSARCSEDQDLLREMGAVGMLRNLVHSKHRMIAMGSSAALRNLLSSAGSGKGVDCQRGGSSNRPTLSARKQRALEEELEAQNLSETCDNVESPRDSPTDSPHRTDGDGRRFVYPYDAGNASTSSSHSKTDEDPRRALHRRQAAMRAGSSDSAERRVRSPQRVPRASSQDSVTSTHSDISHDRSRVHHMLAKSSHLLHRRQGGSLERKKEAPGLHRVSSDHACSALERQSRGGDLSCQGQGQSSRIVRYMQEVALLAGVGSADSNPGHSDPGAQPHNGRGGFLHPPAPHASVPASTSLHSQQRLYEHLSKKNVSVNLGYDRGDDSDSSEQPVNYSLKYQDAALPAYPEPSMMGINAHPTSLQGGSTHPSHPSSVSRPPTTPHHQAHSAGGGSVRMSAPPQFHHSQHPPGTIHINNYVGPAPLGSAPMKSKSGPAVPPSAVHNRYPGPQSFARHPQPRHHQLQQQQQQQPHPGQLYQGQGKGQGSQGSGGQFCAYAETDLDSMEECPTDFSLRYAEDHSDDQDQPVNYSLRYRSDPDPDCVECKYEEARRTNERLEQSANDDQVLTFCTEGTPFLSTATSLTDLTGGKAGGEDEGEAEVKEESRSKLCHHHEPSVKTDDGGDELHNYSARFAECEDTPANSSCGHTASTVRPSVAAATGNHHYDPRGPSSQPNTQQSFHGADDDSLGSDQVKTYCEEGTPVCFSRVSSLSSLHSSEARDNVDQGRPVMLQSIEESDKGEMAVSVIENKNAIGVKTALVDKDQRRMRGAAGGDVEKESKTVTFDEAHPQVEETPLMFSRCSSLGSLSSFDTQSVHSSVVSEYSRRASQVVSPSELPDSPSETMPPSPRRLQSPPIKALKPLAVGGAAGGGGGPVPTSAAVPPALLSAVKSGHVGVKVDWQRGAEDLQMDDKTAKLLDIFRSSIPHKHPGKAVDEAISLSGKSEVPVVYADEGTPPVFSETSSLSALTLDGDANKVKAGAVAVDTMASPSRLLDDTTDSADVTLCEDRADRTLVQEDRDSSMSDVSEGEEDILAQCISAAMPAPTNSSRKMRKSSSDNTIKKKAGASSSAPSKPEAPPTSASKSRLPTKVAPPLSSTPVSSAKSSRPSPGPKSGKPGRPDSDSKKPHNASAVQARPAGNSGSAAKPPRPSGQSQNPPRQPQQQQRQHPPPPQNQRQNVPVADDDYASDTLRTFATEGTPLNFSAATSLSDLSTMTEAPVKVQSPPEGTGSAGFQKSPEDCKSDNSSLCEESEQRLLNDMIQAAMPKSRAARRLDVDKGSMGRGGQQGSKLPSRGGAGAGRGGARRDEARKGGPQLQQHQQQMQQQQQPALATRPNIPMEVPFVGSAPDVVKTYATEGTPNNFSAATSLSDLTIDSVEEMGGGGCTRGGGRLSNGRSPAKSSVGVGAGCPDDALFGLEGTDSPRVYGVEGTPTTFSRNDSLSSIEMLDEKSDGQAAAPPPLYPHASERHVIGQSSEEGSVKSERHRTHRAGNKDETRQFEVEGTPVSFSRNSSLSSLASGGRAKEPQPEEEPQISRTSSMNSLSAESTGFDPTPSEQALLDQCISAAMPKRRPSRGDDKTRRHARAAKNEGRPFQEGGSLKSSTLEMRAGLEDGEATVAMAVYSASLQTQGKLMTRSCSDALDIDSDDGGRPSRYSSWRKKRQMSSDEMKTRRAKETYARSRSQDNFLKTQKEISNRITQSSNESSTSSSNSTSRYAQSCTTSVIHVHSSVAADNRLLDQGCGDPLAAHRDPNLAASFTDSSSSGEKADSEKSICDDHLLSLHSEERKARDDEDDGEDDGKGDEEEEVTFNLDETVMELSSYNQTIVQEPECLEEGEGSQRQSPEDAAAYEDDLEEKLCFGNGNMSFDQDEGGVHSGHASFDQDEGGVYSGHASFDQEEGGAYSGHASFDQEEGGVYSGHASFDQEDGGAPSGHASFEEGITPEDEQLLQENASLIVCEIVTKRDMTGSALEEDMFIENETISLVSNDYTSDTASEVSISWSTNSEKTSERSCSQASQAETVGSGSGLAKVVKPSSKVGSKKLSEEDAKLVRGRRKPLYTKPAPNVGKTGGAARSDASRSRPGSGGGASNSRPNSGVGAGNSRPNSGVAGSARSPAGAGRGSAPQKKTSPRLSGGGAASGAKSNLPGPKASPQTSKSSPTLTTPASKPAGPRAALAKSQLPTGQRPGSGSGIPRSASKGGNTPPSKLPSATFRNKDAAASGAAADRPKPPSKQATFVKDTTFTSREGKGATGVSDAVRLRTRSASRGRTQCEKRNSGSSLGCAKRNSTGSPPEAWSKALDSFNFVVDKSGSGNSLDTSSATKVNQKPRGSGVAKDTPSPPKRTTSAAGGNKLQRPSQIARPQPQSGSAGKGVTAGKTPPGSKPSGPGANRSNLPSRTGVSQSGSSPSLRKTGSGTSLTKTSSGSSLNKGSSGGFKKPGISPPSKVDLKKSESNNSLRRSSGDTSRPSTPNGRRPSNPNQVKVVEKCDPGADEVRRSAGGKKQVPSKIASLWKKEEGVERSVSMEEPAVAAATRGSFKLKSKSSSLPAAARTMAISSGTFVKKSSSVTSQSSSEDPGSSMEAIPRSSTYDKFPGNDLEPSAASLTWQNSEDDGGVTSSGEGMLELCDPSSDGLDLGPSSLESGEVNLDEAYIQDDGAGLAGSTDSLDDASTSEETPTNQLSVTTSAIDSSTWRRSKRPQKEGDVTLQLPNADETCRSMCSFLTANDSQNESMIPVGDLSVWQKCGNDSVISELSFAAGGGGGGGVGVGGKAGKGKGRKSVAKSIKSTFAGFKLFGSKQSKEAKELAKAEKSMSKKSPTESEPKTACASTSTSTGTSTCAAAPKMVSIPPAKPSPAAIVAPVAPFNYSPPSASHISMTNSAPAPAPVLSTSQAVTKDATVVEIVVEGSGSQKKGQGSGSGPVAVTAPTASTKHMTKTEMLLARRRQSYLNSTKQDDGGESDSSQRGGCMVTTV